MTTSKFSRRTFLEGMGLSAALLPLIGPDAAHAAGTVKRSVFVGWTNGYVMNAWRPGAGFAFGEILKPLEPYKAKTLVVDGVGQKVHYEADARALGWGKDQWYGGHDGYPGVLTGVPCSKYADNLEWSGGDSMDQYIAMEIGKQTKLPFESLVLAGSKEAGGYYGSLSYKGKSPGITAERSPFNLFKKLFSSPAMPGPQIDKTLIARKSILDYLGKTATGFGARLGGDDKHQIETHLGAIRDIEKQLMAGGNVPGGGSGACNTPDIGANFNLDANNFPKQIKVLQDLIVAAFKCDLTRVVSMTYTNAGGDDMFFPFLGSEFVGGGDEYPERQYHDITHNQDKSSDHKRRKTRVEQWFFEQVAYLAGQLQMAPDPAGGSLLDSTIVCVTNSMGTNHDSHVQPFTLVGNIGNYLETGQAIKANNDAHNRVLVTVANAMGVDGSKWGASKYASELPGMRA